MFRSILILFLFIGVLLVVVEIARTEKVCPKQITTYKYIPRTFEEEQEQPVYPSEIFKAMFTQPTPWIGTMNDLDTRRKEAINKFFISQS